jgi:hypothetical protein
MNTNPLSSKGGALTAAAIGCACFRFTCGFRSAFWFGFWCAARDRSAGANPGETRGAAVPRRHPARPPTRHPPPQQGRTAMAAMVKFRNYGNGSHLRGVCSCCTY